MIPVHARIDKTEWKTSLFPKNARYLQRTYHVRPIGAASPVRESYYAISPERVLKQPTVRRITDVARERLSRLT